MVDEKQPTGRTPKGLDVPIAERREFFDNLKKVAKSDKPSAPVGSKK